jgi:hypothetical protein
MTLPIGIEQTQHLESNVAALEFRHHERIRLRLKARRLNEFAKMLSLSASDADGTRRTTPATSLRQRATGRRYPARVL